MKVRAGRESSIADGGDQLSARDALPRAHHDARAVRELGDDAVPVVDLERVAVTRFVPDRPDDPRRGGHDRRAHGRREVDALVRAILVEHGVEPARGKVAREPTGARHDGRRIRDALEVPLERVTHRTEARREFGCTPDHPLDVRRAGEIPLRYLSQLWEKTTWSRELLKPCLGCCSRMGR